MSFLSESFLYESLPARVHFEVDAATTVRAEVDRLGWKRVLLISSVRDAALATKLSAGFGDRVVARFTGVRAHVPVAVRDEVVDLALERAADGIISVGGGSTTGTAKILALSTRLPIIAIPTTYAGSEMTPVWGLTTAQRKETGIDPVVQPTVVIYDPALLATLPDSIATASGLNAMAHCVEAYWTPRSNPVVRVIATEGVEALAGGLRSLKRDDDSKNARTQLLYGALLAGMSFASAGSGLHHKICHALGGAFDLPHAQTHAVILPRVLAFNEPAVPDAAARMARALGSVSAADGLIALYAMIGAPASLRELGLTEAQLPEAIDIVAEKLPIDNPRAVDRDDIAAILSAAFHGRQL
ncbi:maleylacetate reductase [soil metagenome]